MKGIGLPRRKDPTESVRSIRRTDQPGPRFNYELFNGNNFNIRYWSWNYRGCWHVVSRCLFFRYRHPPEVLAPKFSFRTKVLYNPKAFFTHAALLDQGFPHCPKFPTAASRRSLGRVSVPVWLVVLSDQLQIVALVGLYPTN